MVTIYNLIVVLKLLAFDFIDGISNFEKYL